MGRHKKDNSEVLKLKKEWEQTITTVSKKLTTPITKKVNWYVILDYKKGTDIDYYFTDTECNLENLTEYIKKEKIKGWQVGKELLAVRFPTDKLEEFQKANPDIISIHDVRIISYDDDYNKNRFHRITEQWKDYGIHELNQNTNK